MSINLLDMLKDQVTGSLAKGAAGFLGESESGISKALGEGIFPTLLGSLINKGGTEDGATGLLNVLKDHDGGVLDNIGGLFGGGSDAVSGLMNSGSGILSMLLGNKMGGIVDMIAKMAGLKGSTSSSLLKMAAPYLLGMVGRYVRKNGLGVSGLMDMLSGQKEHVKAATPAGWNPMDMLSGAIGGVTGAAGSAVGAAGNVVGAAADKVGDAAGRTVDAGKKVVGGAADLAGKGVGAVGNLAGKGVDAVGDVGGAAVKTGGSILRWLLPLVILLGALGFYITQCGGSTGIDALDDAATKVSDTATDGVKAAGDVAGDVADGAAELAGAAFGKIDAAAKATLDGVKWVAGSAGDQMMKFIDGGAEGEGVFRFNNLNFASGSAAIDGASGAEVDNLSKILAAYPDVKVVIEGYTDNTGDAAKNVELSMARAQAVKARLIGAGIDAGRVSAKGYGADNPVADNGTAEGRKENRRIEVRIVQ